jgi:hypothetical protein
MWGVMRFLRNDDSGRQSPGDSRTFKVVLAGLIPLLLIVLLSVFVPALTQGLLAVPTSMILLLLTVALMVNALSFTRAKDAPEKRKRELENVDMYAMIDRLVDDLDEDEIEYLRRRLEGRGDNHQLTKSLETLLDQRSETRQSQSQQ